MQIVKNRTSFRRCGWIQWLNCKMEIKWSCRVRRSTARNWPHSFTTGESHPTIIHRPIGNWTRNSKIAIAVVFPFCKTCKRRKKRAILSHDSPAAPNNKYCRQSRWIDTKYFSDLVYWYKMHGSKSFTLKVDVFLWKWFFYDWFLNKLWLSQGNWFVMIDRWHNHQTDKWLRIAWKIRINHILHCSDLRISHVTD